MLPLLGVLAWGDPGWTQALPAPIRLEGYERFWQSRTPQQRLQWQRQEPEAMVSASPPIVSPAVRDPEISPSSLTPVPAHAALLNPESAWVIPQQEPLELLTPVLLAQRQSEAPSTVTDVARPILPAAPSLSVWDKFPLLSPSAPVSPLPLQPRPVQAELAPQRTTQLSESSVWERFPVLSPTLDPPVDSTAVGTIPSSPVLDRFPLLTPFPRDPDPLAFSGDPQFSADASVAVATPLDATLLQRFPVLKDIPESSASPGSRLRQELNASLVTQLPLDPNQVNVQGDQLRFDNEAQVGIAEGNAVAQFADGTTIEAERLLYYRQEQRLRTEGPFVLRQPINRGSSQQRQVQGRDLDFDIPTRSAQFFSSLVILPGEAAGTLVYVRSEEATALIDNQLFFENATVTTSPEPPITHYVKGDRVEVYPNDQVIVHTARVFAGGQQDPSTGDLGGGTQIAFFPLFIYSLRDHQWILPGFSEPEGVYVKSSWAYRFNEYNFGGLRLDAIQKKGVGVGLVHDYILPIANSANYGRAQLYLVTEADQNRLSSRFRVDHFYDFYNMRLFGTEGTLRGSLVLNFDNVYRPTGGRNDNADMQLTSTFTAPFSTTTLNVSRTASATLGTYRFPITLNHNQRFADVPWLRSNLRIDYANQLNISGAQDISTARLEASLQATPPTLGNFNLIYRAFGSSNGDTDSSRRNLELTYSPPTWRISPTMSLSTNLSLSQNQQRNSSTGGQQFFERYDFRNSLRFNEVSLAPWATFIPGSIDYAQVLYSTGNQESTVSFNPRMTIKPNNWSNLELRFNRIFQGNNSTPFQAIPILTRDTHRFNANLSFFTPVGTLPNVPPGYIAFEDDLPGEAPIAIVFEDDTEEDRAEIASRQVTLAQETVKTLWRFDSTTGFDWITNRWDLVTANFTWNTTPTLYNMQLSTSYDPNTGQMNPINLRWSGRSSTTFDRDLRSGLTSYEPGISYGLQVSYDPKKGRFEPYTLDLDATIGSTWENHWRFRVGIGDDGIRLLEIRRDLRDFEVRLAYDPQAEILRLEGILVAFPSQPVGLVQQRGDFLLNTPVGTIGGDDLLP
ncbi:MAG: hypothetical protein OHK0012_00370 [Synechococcales cyanobacterium]